LRDLNGNVTLAGGATSAAYDTFAPYYDAFTSASDYEAWGRETLAHARRHGLHGKRLLDLACGTGMSFMPFLERGFTVTACDFSTAMLAEAARRAPAARLVHADIRALPDLGEFDLVSAFDDALNYLLDEDELEAALHGMKRSLAPAGVAVFDLNSLLAYRTTFAADSVTGDGELARRAGGLQGGRRAGRVRAGRAGPLLPRARDAPAAPLPPRARRGATRARRTRLRVRPRRAARLLAGRARGRVRASEGRLRRHAQERR
jgi:SAM-dependent methyltransferase